MVGVCGLTRRVCGVSETRGCRKVGYLTYDLEVSLIFSASRVQEPLNACQVIPAVVP
jgi:hypothetical protein